ncbi:MAG TPA: SprB repeat-containing protein, partial [Flavipsychrobacter sp.]|nr:SprB repeat-containing protein [Flavipsychrobacter sp.]
MRKLSLLFTAIVCGVFAKAQVPINNSNFLYGQTFNILQTQTNVSYPMNIANWQIFEFGTNQFVNNQYRGGNGSDANGEIYSFGQTTSSLDRSLGSLATGSPNSLEAHYGVSFVNNTGSTITTFNIGFRQEQWRVGDANPLPDTVRVYYSTNATSIGDLGATWTEISPLMMTSYASDSTSSGSVLNGNLQNVNKFAVVGMTLPNGGIVRVKFVDRNNPGEDDGLSIDNFFAHIGYCAPGASFIVDSAGCYGDHNGQITVEAFGGQAPYEYSLNGGMFQPSNTFSNLTAGVYYIDIKESGNNCIANTNLVVFGRDSIPVSFGVTASSCMDSNGTAWANVTGTQNP